MNLCTNNRYINGVKGWFFIVVNYQCWLVMSRSIGEGKLSFYSYHKAVTKIKWEKDHHQMLNVEESFEEQDIYMILKCLPTDCLLAARERIVNYILEKLESTLVRWLQLASLMTSRWTCESPRYDTLGRTLRCVEIQLEIHVISLSQGDTSDKPQIRSILFE